MCDIKKSNPIVTYHETVTAHSSQLCMTKSPNKHNILSIQAEPLSEELIDAIEN